MTARGSLRARKIRGLFRRCAGIRSQKYYELFGAKLESAAERMGASGEQKNMCIVTIGGYQQPAEVNSWGCTERLSEFYASFTEAITSGLRIIYIYPDISVGESGEFGEKAISSAGQSVSFGLHKVMEHWHGKLKENVFADDVPDNFKLVGVVPHKFPFYGPGNYYLLRNKDHYWGAMSSYDFPQSELERLPQESPSNPTFFVEIHEKEGKRLMLTVEELLG